MFHYEFPCLICSSNLQSHNPVRSIFFKSSSWLPLFSFPVVASPLLGSFSACFGVNRDRITFAAVISPIAVCFGRVFCFVLWFMRQTVILPLPGLNTPQFECDVKFTMPFTTIVMNNRNNSFPHHADFSLHPLRSYSGAFRLSTVFLFEITVLRCTCYRHSQPVAIPPKS